MLRWLHHLKRIRASSKNRGRGTNFKMTAKMHENGYLRKSRISENPAGRRKIALAQQIFEQITSNLLHLKGMSYICVTVAQNWALSFILGLQFWSKVENSKFRDIPFFGGQTLRAPRSDLKKFLDPKTVFLYSICPNLNFDTT